MLTLPRSSSWHLRDAKMWEGDLHGAELWFDQEDKVWRTFGVDNGARGGARACLAIEDPGRFLVRRAEYKHGLAYQLSTFCISACDRPLCTVLLWVLSSPFDSLRYHAVGSPRAPRVRVLPLSAGAEGVAARKARVKRSMEATGVCDEVSICVEAEHASS